jgi:type IV secretion system protein VirB10
MPETPSGSSPIRNHATKAPGILPRYAQAWLLGGIALVMVLVITLTGGKAPTNQRAAPTPGAAANPDDARIQEVRTRIEQQLQRLALEQARLGQARQRLGELSGAGGVMPDDAVSAGPTLSVAPPPDSRSLSAAFREKSWIELDREKREYQSRYASNVALTRRNAPNSEPSGRTDQATDRAREPHDSSTLASAEVRAATGNMYRLFEGTVIESVLTNRLDGSFSGPINCLVGTQVFSHDRSKLLIPQGTRALGTVSRVEAQGQHRLAVAFHRLIMPDGYSVSLDKLPGLSQQGETGLLDQINHHYLQIFGVSLAIGAIAGLSQMNTEYGVEASAADAYRHSTATSLSQTSLNILDRYLNVLPTFTVREGHRVKVYLTGDLLLPAYENHTVPGDI